MMDLNIGSVGGFWERFWDEVEDTLSGRSVMNMFSKKKVFVSFDYENNKHYKYLLEAWHANPKFDFSFNDMTPTEIQSSDVGRIKAALTAKVNAATHTLVIVGQYANQLHRDRAAIGFKNWINFEIHQSKENNNRIAVVRLKPNFEFPDEFLTSTGKYIDGFSEENVARVLEAA